MGKKNAWTYVVYCCGIISSYSYILLFITKILVIHIHTPGAQGGTGGW